MKRTPDGPATLCAVLLVMLVATVAKWHPHETGDWAGWFQAVGSITAVGVAIWVSHKQYRDARVIEQEKRNSEVLAYLQAIHAELSTLWDGYSNGVGTALKLLPEGRPFMVSWGGTIDAFTIYNNNSVFVGRISDSELRTLLVSSYAKFKGIILSINTNNGLLTKLQEQFQAGEWDRNQSQLIEYAGALKRDDSELSLRIPRLLSVIEAHIATLAQ